MTQTKERVHGRDLSGEEMAQLLGEFVNGFGREKAKTLQAGIVREHRTLQRNIFCLALDMIDAFAEMERTDARNEQTKEMAQEIKNLIGGRRPWLI